MMKLDRSQALSQSLGLTVTVKPIFGWGQTVTLGRDGTATRSSGGARGYRVPDDTLLKASYFNNGTTSMNYRVNGNFSLGSSVGATVVSGVNTSQISSNGVSGSGGTVAQALSLTSGTAGSGYQGRNLNGFFQVTARFLENVYFTYGLNSEWNKKYGDTRNPNLQPKYGATVVFEVGLVTLKPRISYGAATKPPELGWKNGIWSTSASEVGIYGPFMRTLPNPDLGPSYQYGTEGGLDLYLGNNASISLSSYNQKVKDLIMFVYTDSVAAINELYPGGGGWTCGIGVVADNCGPRYFLQGQFFNVASIRNQGYTATSNVTLGALTLVGNYSWTKSRSLGYGSYISVANNGQFSRYAPGASIGGLAEHTWSLTTTYSTNGSSISLVLNGQGQVDAGNSGVFLNVNSGNFAGRVNSLRLALYDSPLYLEGQSSAFCSGKCFPSLLNSGYLRGDLNARHKVSSRVSANMNTTNLFNSYHFDGDNNYTTKGRTVRTGFSVDL